MVDFGIATFPTDYGIDPVDLATAVEERGFESLFYAEHTHIPASRKTPFVVGGDLPKEYWHTHDQFVALAMAAAVTERIKLGTFITLVTEHDPINLAKRVASLDRLSKGRLLFGIGAGWNQEEMEDHGVAFADRWKVTRERVLAMKTIWTEDDAEYHGDFVDFDAMWSWPKPLQAGGPPVLMGAWSKWTAARIAEYCDGWLPLDGTCDFEACLADIRQEMAKADRSMDGFNISYGMASKPGDPPPSLDRVKAAVDLGVDRVIFLPPAAAAAETLPALDHFANLAAKFA